MYIEVMWYPDAEDLPCIVRTGRDQVGGNYLVLEYLLFGIDILQEHIEGLQSLGDAALNVIPLGPGEYAGNNVEGKYLLNAGIVAVHGKGDPLVHEQLACKLVLLPQDLDGQKPDIFVDLAILGADLMVFTHLIPDAREIIVLIEELLTGHELRLME